MSIFSIFGKSAELVPPAEWARAVLPDAVDDEHFYLVKACSELNLTYEIRLTAFAAQKNRRSLCLLLSGGTVLTEDLKKFVKTHGIAIDRGPE